MGVGTLDRDPLTIGNPQQHLVQLLPVIAGQHRHRDGWLSRRISLMPWKWVRLVEVEHVGGTKGHRSPLILLILLRLAVEDGSQNQNSLLPFPNTATEFEPVTEAGDLSRGRFLGPNQENVRRGVGVETGLPREVLSESGLRL